MWIVIGIGALVVWLFRFTLPESPRYLATHGKGKEALDVLARLGIAGPKEPLTTDAASDTKSDPFAVVFKMFPTRVVAGMICFSAFFGVAIGLGTWLPNIMTAKGFTITKSLTYTFGMTLAVPCASLFMMYALDHFGRKITSVCAFVAAGLMAIVFANAATDTQLLVAGFVMIFFIQVAGNSMQIFRVRGVPHQRAGVRLRLGSGRRPAGDRRHRAGDPVDPDRLGPDDGVRVPGRGSADRGRLGHAIRGRKPDRRGSTRSPRRPGNGERSTALADGGASARRRRFPMPRPFPAAMAFGCKSHISPMAARR